VHDRAILLDLVGKMRDGLPSNLEEQRFTTVGTSDGGRG